jgi:D-sedoheptulose 7-phosphate isomerase
MTGLKTPPPQHAALPTESAPAHNAALIERSLAAASDVLSTLRSDAQALDTLARIGATLSTCFSTGHKVIICGNGGSLCDAAHFAEELTGRFRNDRRPLPAIALSDPGHITCTANDYGFDQIFARSIDALGNQGDLLIILSTSGNSPNCIAALQAGQRKGMTIATFLGKRGGTLAGKADHEICVAGETSDRIQELHMLMLHILVELVEAAL